MTKQGTNTEVAPVEVGGTYDAYRLVSKGTHKIVSIGTLQHISRCSKQASSDHRAEFRKTGSEADLRLAEYCDGQHALCEFFIKHLSEISTSK